MTLRARTLLLFGILFVSLFLTLYLAFSRIVLKSFRDLEAVNLRQDMERVQQALETEFSSLNSTASDWAGWDDTYEFVTNGNQRYINANITDVALTNLRLHFMCFLDPASRLVYGQARDWRTEEKTKMPPALQGHFTPGDSLVTHPNTESSRAGFLMLPECPLIVASRPVLTSQNEGPIRGTLILGRYFNAAAVRRFSTITGLSLSFARCDSWAVPGGTVQPLTDSVAGYKVLPDIYGKPALTMRVAVPRTIYRHGRASLHYLLAAMLAVSLAFGLAMIILLERWVLSPLSRLHREVQQVGSDLNRRVTEKGRDELSSLARALNDMLNALQESEEKFVLFMRHFPGFASIQDPSTRLIFVNEAMEQALRRRREDLLGKASAEIWGEERGKIIRDEDIGILSRNMASQKLEQLALPGGPRTYLTYKFPIIRRGQPSLLGGLSVDVTERQQAEEALAAEKERLAVTLRSIGDGVITTDVQGRILLLNGVAEELTGWTAAEALGRPLAEVFDIRDEKERKPLPGPAEEVLRRGILYTLERPAVLVSRSGAERMVSDSCAPICDRESKIVGAVLVFRDITERRKLEASLVNADKLESIGLLAGGIAHDFNNLLMGIFGYMEMARDQVPPGADASGTLDKALQVFNRAKDLTQQLLTFARGGAPVKKIIALGPFLRETVQFSLSGAAVTHQLSVDENLWPCEADEGQIAQVINNIVLNAVQAMPGGGALTVRAENLRLAGQVALPLPDGPYVRIGVKDTGSGIAPEHLPRIFDPFFTTKEKGSGLGLTTAYSIIRKHGGHIQAESSLGRGTLFYIYLPAAPEADLSQAPSRPALYQGQGTILVMDDEEFMRDVLRKMLTAMGFSVRLTRHGQEALEAYREALAGGRPFTAVILDLTIPGGLGGKETLANLRQFHPEVKAIAVSGYSLDPVISQPREFGFAAAIKKPFTIHELGQTLGTVLA